MSCKLEKFVISRKCVGDGPFVNHTLPSLPFLTALRNNLNSRPRPFITLAKFPSYRLIMLIDLEKRDRNSFN